MSPTGWVLLAVAAAVGLAIVAGGMITEYAAGPKYDAVTDRTYPSHGAPTLHNDQDIIRSMVARAGEE